MRREQVMVHNGVNAPENWFERRLQEAEIVSVGFDAPVYVAPEASKESVESVIALAA